MIKSLYKLINKFRFEFFFFFFGSFNAILIKCRNVNKNFDSFEIGSALKLYIPKRFPFFFFCNFRAFPKESEHISSYLY